MHHKRIARISGEGRVDRGRGCVEYQHTQIGRSGKQIRPPHTLALDRTLRVAVILLRKRAELYEALVEEGYTRRRRRGDDRTVFLSEDPWKPQVFVHDDGWVYFRRQPPRETSADPYRYGRSPNETP